MGVVESLSLILRLILTVRLGINFWLYGVHGDSNALFFGIR
jgi:hypothetical protein